MVRLVLAFFLLWASQATAETAARLHMAGSQITESWFAGTTLTLSLSRPVPFRVFTLDEPRRLIIDLEGVDAAAFSETTFLADQAILGGARMGEFLPGWTRLVADLTEPVAPDEVAMNTNTPTGGAQLTLKLKPVAEAAFAAQAGPPPGVRWTPSPPPAQPEGDAFVVVLDPGHGGVDPGAEREGVSEKELTLVLARHLAEALAVMDGVEVVLTRHADRFVSLDARVNIAQAVHADLFLSLHADALPDGGAEGATLYTLSEEASDSATAQLAARHNRADILAGADLREVEDGLTQVLLDIARRETRPHSIGLARDLAQALEAAGIPMNNRPLREAGFAVLKSADIPSVLLEVGFLSSPRDLANVQDPAWRAQLIAGLTAAIERQRAKADRRASLSRP